jgi:hypothetical protein
VGTANYRPTSQSPTDRPARSSRVALSAAIHNHTNAPFLPTVEENVEPRRTNRALAASVATALKPCARDKTKDASRGRIGRNTEDLKMRRPIPDMGSDACANP